MIVDKRLGNTPRWFLSEPKDYRMRVPDEILRCVGFLGVRAPGKSQMLYAWKGTAFVVEMPFAAGNGFHRYLVTADHVLQDLDKEAAMSQRRGGAERVLRLNTTDGAARCIDFGPDVVWYRHPTDLAADVVVRPFEQPAGDFDLKAIPTTMFLSDADIAREGIGIGHDVVLAGLFSELEGEKRNLPAARMGTIAMMPSERVPVEDRGSMEAYLVEARSTGGISGSPVFVQDLSLNRATGKLASTLYLLGLMHGHWQFGSHEPWFDVPAVDEGASPTEAAVAASVDAVRSMLAEGVNTGIGVVVPAKSIMETLERQELAHMRQEAEEQHRRRHLPRPD